MKKLALLYGLLIFFTSLKSYAADNWCISDPKNPPCHGSPGKCIKNPDGSEGGFVANTAKVELSENGRLSINASVCGEAIVKENAQVLDFALISGQAQVYGNARVFGEAKVFGHAKVSGDAEVYQKALVFGAAEVSESASILGEAGVYERALVYGNALVEDKAEIYGKAEISGYAWVYEDAKVFGEAWVEEDAIVHGKAQVHGKAFVHEDAEVYGEAEVKEEAEISGNAQVYDKAVVSGKAKVYDEAWVYGSSWVTENAQIYEDAQIYKFGVVSGNAHVYGDALVGNSSIDGNKQIFGRGKVQSTISWENYVKNIPPSAPPPSPSKPWQLNDFTKFFPSGNLPGPLDKVDFMPTKAKTLDDFQQFLVENKILSGQKAEVMESLNSSFQQCTERLNNLDTTLKTNFLNFNFSEIFDKSGLIKSKFLEQNFQINPAAMQTQAVETNYTEELRAMPGSFSDSIAILTNSFLQLKDDCQISPEDKDIQDTLNLLASLEKKEMKTRLLNYENPPKFLIEKIEYQLRFLAKEFSLLDHSTKMIFINDLIHAATHCPDAVVSMSNQAYNLAPSCMADIKRLEEKLRQTLGAIKAEGQLLLIALSQYRQEAMNNFLAKGLQKYRDKNNNEEPEEKETVVAATREKWRNYLGLSSEHPAYPNHKKLDLKINDLYDTGYGANVVELFKKLQKDLGEDLRSKCYGAASGVHSSILPGGALVLELMLRYQLITFKAKK